MLFSNLLTLSAFGLACAAPTGPRRDLDGELESVLSLLGSLLGQATAVEAATTATVVNGAPSTVGAPNPTASAQAPSATGQAIKDFTGNCLTIDALAGNSSVDPVPASITPCNGSVGQQFSFFSNTTQPPAPIPGSVLIVSSLNQGCLSFNKVDPFNIKFTACVDNTPDTADVALSQAFQLFDTTGEFALAPFGNDGNICLASTGGKLQPANCVKTDDEQSFTLDDAGSASATDGSTLTAVASATGATVTAGLKGAAATATVGFD
ncbi:putative mg2+ transporter protein [Mycena sanguinolenta]|uniref:Putative mg2+ transporter protein n=1 Tax=Mycena sanguinolenta TaxID=230812 RepID=A0A8H6Z260_9AGAR|nr:putative mg2+ transporter protein [Mycena sanguinolenta]